MSTIVLKNKTRFVVLSCEKDNPGSDWVWRATKSTMQEALDLDRELTQSGHEVWIVPKNKVLDERESRTAVRTVTVG